MTNLLLKRLGITCYDYKILWVFVDLVLFFFGSGGSSSSLWVCMHVHGFVYVCKTQEIIIKKVELKHWGRYDYWTVYLQWVQLQIIIQKESS